MNLPSMRCLHSYAIPTAGPTCTPMITAMVIVSREDAPKQEAHIDEVVVDDVIHLSAGIGGTCIARAGEAHAAGTCGTVAARITGRCRDVARGSICVKLSLAKPRGREAAAVLPLIVLSVCDAGHGGRAKELTRLGIASGAGKAARSLSRYVKENRTLVVTSVCAIVLVMLLENVLDKENMKLDAAAWWLFGEQLRQPWLTPIMESFSALATPVTLLVVLGVAAAFTPVKRPGWCNVLNLGLVVLLNQAMKFAIQRPRPDVLRLVDVSGFSFPSGHSMAAMAVFGLLAWCVWRYERNPRRRIALMCLFALVIVMVGISRIYLGVHYASDVLGGFCVSTIWLVLYTKVIAPALGLIE